MSRCQYAWRMMDSCNNIRRIAILFMDTMQMCTHGNSSQGCDSIKRIPLRLQGMPIMLSIAKWRNSFKIARSLHFLTSIFIWLNIKFAVFVRLLWHITLEMKSIFQTQVQIAVVNFSVGLLGSFNSILGSGSTKCIGIMFGAEQITIWIINIFNKTWIWCLEQASWI